MSLSAFYIVSSRHRRTACWPSTAASLISQDPSSLKSIGHEQLANNTHSPTPMKRRLLDPRATATCTLGDPGLDRILRGGVPCGSITEIVGEPQRRMFGRGLVV